MIRFKGNPPLAGTQNSGFIFTAASSPHVSMKQGLSFLMPLRKRIKQVRNTSSFLRLPILNFDSNRRYIRGLKFNKDIFPTEALTKLRKSTNHTNEKKTLKGISQSNLFSFQINFYITWEY
jgi:hypothetical protein